MDEFPDEFSVVGVIGAATETDELCGSGSDVAECMLLSFFGSDGLRLAGGGCVAATRVIVHDGRGMASEGPGRLSLEAVRDVFVRGPAWQKQPGMQESARNARNSKECKKQQGVQGTARSARNLPHHTVIRRSSACWLQQGMHAELSGSCQILNDLPGKTSATFKSFSEVKHGHG